MNKPAIKIQHLIDKVKYSHTYYDNEAWTIPILLTTERAARLCEDNSVHLVRFYIGENIIECEMI